ncbi:hypothetical protein DQ04_09581010 [Trypanosoma grayi]|uniref:hypothetical protein n=1 Tax=Trypanosoma grayi TaxID=71804 RepID=UPI0004F46758|nr:hypothetical protein DQ04_09581010 [Trypanosoma grayi]KEG07509.1 hypothetical protein DQ04_09581010 [Trypanosoma grayi]
MEQLLPYEVVYRTSEDEGFPITELGHGPASPVTGPPAAAAVALLRYSKGWQSARNGKMPQTIVLRFPGNVELTQMRILSHEYKIASLVEVRLFALKRTDTETDPPSFRAVRFTKLGAVAFNSNEHSNFRFKERKTVHLQAEAYFVKLLFNAPHRNAQNRFNQVGVYSIECSGRILSRVLRHSDAAVVGGEMTPPPPSPVEHSPTRSDTSSLRQQQHQPMGQQPTRSLSPTPAQHIIPHGIDPPAFRSVRILEFEDFFIRRSEELLTLKDQAVAVEDFDTAKECRDRINLMNRRSKRIYQIEQDKVQAIIEEDFDAAKKARQMMDALIEEVYEDAKLPKPKPDFDPYACADDAFNVKVDANGLHGVAAAKAGADGGWHSKRNSTSSRKGRNVAHSGDRSVVDGGACNDGHRESDAGSEDERGPIVSDYARRMADLVHDLTDAIDEVDPPPDNDGNSSIGDAAPQLVEEAQLQPWERRAAQAIMSAACEMEGPRVLRDDMKNSREALDLAAAVGTYTTACLFSKRFKLREAVFEVLMDDMANLYQSRPVVIEEVVLRFLDLNGRGLQDTIPNVVAACCAFVRMVLADEHKCLVLVLAPLANLLPRLLCCAADANARVREEAFSTLTLCVKTLPLTNATILTAVLADPVDKDRRRLPSCNTRVQMARLTVLEQLVSIGRMGLRSTAEGVWTKLLLPCVNHQSQEVRDLAVSVTTLLVQERKLVLTPRRAGEIDKAAVRDQLKAIAAQMRPSTVAAAAANTPAAGETGISPRSAAKKRRVSARRQTPVKDEKAP